LRGDALRSGGEKGRKRKGTEGMGEKHPPPPNKFMVMALAD